MKSIKQSRLDRLERRRVKKIAMEEKHRKMTKRERLAEYSKILKQTAKEFKKRAEQLCQHKVGFKGYYCFACNPDKVADILRESWLPTEVYDAIVVVSEPDGDHTELNVKIRARNLTKKVREMQETGFWYEHKKKPVYMMPGNIKVVVVKDTAQNPGYTDLDSTPEPEEPVQTRFAQQ